MQLTLVLKEQTDECLFDELPVATSLCLVVGFNLINLYLLTAEKVMTYYRVGDKLKENV